MTDPGLLALLRLNSVPLFSPDAVRKALAAAAATELLELPTTQLAQLMGVRESSARRFKETARGFDVEGELRLAETLGVRTIAESDPDYPEGLRGVKDAPLLLYARGCLAQPPAAAAVVGSRRPSAYGLRMGRRFGFELGRAGVLVVSGLARGVDAEAHEGALAARGRTWAVLGCGLGRVYPPENEPLAARIVEAGGAVLSELPLAARPDRLSFPRRNRIVAGLCWAVVVVEGRIPSGSLITAHAAAELQRDVFAVPGPADSPLSDAPHSLLRSGARPACGAADVLASLPSGQALAAQAAGPLHSFIERDSNTTSFIGRASLEQRKIVEWLGADALTVDALSERTGIAVPRLVNILFEMELQGVVKPFPGQRYGKKSPY